MQVPDGFTLVEVLVATAVASILLVVLASLFESTTTAYSSDQRRSSSTAESRAGFEILRADLRSYCALPDDPDRQGDEDVPRFILFRSQDDYGSDRVAFLRFARPRAGRSGGVAVLDSGSLMLVVYAVGYTQDAGGRWSQKLYRREFTPEDTMTRIQNLLASGTPLVGVQEWGAIANGMAGAEPVVFQLVRFQIVPYARMSEQPDTATTDGITSQRSLAWNENHRPLCVDVVLRVTNRAMAARLDSQADWMGQGRMAEQLLGRPPTPTNYEDDPEVDTQRIRILLPQS